jgi:hypothetical protein
MKEGALNIKLLSRTQLIQKHINHIIALDTGGLSIKSGEYAMAQNRMCHCGNIGGGGMIPPVEYSAGLGSSDQTDTGTRTGTP